MAKKVTGFIKLQLPAGAATPAPPVGPALGQHGVNIMQFVKQYNEQTPPAAALLKKAAGLDKGSGNPLKQKVGTVSEAQLRELAQLKLPDLNANDIEGAMKILSGTARSMGIEIK